MAAIVNNRKSIFQGRVFSFDSENITLENGVTIDLEVIRHPGAAAIVPFWDPQTIILIRQFRHAVNGTIWEIPAGTLAPGESPLNCARRELAEETGYAAATWSHLGVITPVPGYSDERVHLFMAADLTPAPSTPDMDEIIDVEFLPCDQIRSMIDSNTIQDAKSICGLLMAFARQH